MKFEQAELAVELTEQKLTRLDSLTSQQLELKEAIEQLSLDESDVLASELPEKKRLDSLLKLRASRDIKQADLSKLKSEQLAVLDEVIVTAIEAHRELCLLRDEIVNQRKAQVVDQLSSILPKKLIELLPIGHALPVRQVWQEHFVIMRQKPLEAVKAARKLRSLYMHLCDPERQIEGAGMPPAVAIDERPSEQKLGSM